MELSSRHVPVAGISEYAYGVWMKQIGGNPTAPLAGFLTDMRYIILDRDSLYTGEFRELLKQAGVKVIRLPTHSSNLNAYAERFVWAIEESCLIQMISFKENSLRRAISKFHEYYHHEQNHQRLDHRNIGRSQVAGRPCCFSRTARRSAAILLS